MSHPKLKHSKEPEVVALNDFIDKLATKYTGAKYDTGKSRFDLLVPDFELEMAKVLTYGADLYGEYSWKTVPNPVPRYTAALRRHANAMAKGQIYDRDTGYTHAAHIAINAMFLQYFQTKKEEW